MTTPSPLKKRNRVFVTLRCDKCKRTMRSPKEDTDPSGTAIVESTCDRCDAGGGFPETIYFNRAGQQYYGPQEGWR